MRIPDVSQYASQYGFSISQYTVWRIVAPLSNSLDSYQVGCSVGPDLCPNYLQRSKSRRENSLLVGKEFIYITTLCLLEI